MFKKYNIKSLSSTDILFLIAFTHRTLWGYVKVILSRIPFIGGERSTILTITIVFILIFASIQRFVKVLKPIDFIFYFVALTVFLLQYLIYPENQLYLDEFSKKFLISSLPFYFLGRIIEYNKISNLITLISILSIIGYSLIHFAVNDISKLNEAGDMYAAYIIMPFIVLTIMDAFKTSNKISIITSIYSFVLLLSLGNRGSVLYTIIFIAICIIYKIKYTSVVKKLLVYTMIGIILYFIMYVFLDNIYDQFEKIGLSTRIFDKINENELDTSGRDLIYQKLLGELRYNILGFGLTGDRVFLKDSFAHNIFIELLFSFGYIIGSIIIIILLYVVTKAYIKAKNNDDYLFYMALVSFGLLPLMTSSSFLVWPNFYMLIGYSITILKKRYTIIRNNIK